jgi:hypothetical protein
MIELFAAVFGFLAVWANLSGEPIFSGSDIYSTPGVINLSLFYFFLLGEAVLVSLVIDSFYIFDAFIEAFGYVVPSIRESSNFTLGDSTDYGAILILFY